MQQAHALALEDYYKEAREKFYFIIETLDSQQARRMTHSELEELLQSEGTELLRRLLQAHLDTRASSEQRVEVADEAGVERQSVRSSQRQLMSVFGTVEVNRLAYAAPKIGSLHPLDGELNLAKELYSHGVRRLAAEEVVKSSFDEVVESISRSSGARVSKRQAEELVQRAAHDFEAFYKQRGQQAQGAADVGGEILVLSSDGKGVMMRKQDLREATRKAAEASAQKLAKRRSKGEKTGRKRMATVASVYTIEPYRREVESVLKEFAPLKEVASKRPRPEDKRVWASVERGVEEVVSEAFAEGLRRDPERKKQWIALVDGNETQLKVIEREATERGIGLQIILDIIHVLEYLWRAAYVFEREGSRAAEAWVTERLRGVLEGRSTQVAGGIRRSATLRGLRPKQREAADKCADYLLKYGSYLRYDEYLAAGYPIGTGVIEGACRYLVKDRMDRTGARWSINGAEAVLKLRSLKSSDDFEEYWRFHLEQELKRNHLQNYSEGILPIPARDAEHIGKECHLRVVK